MQELSFQQVCDLIDQKQIHFYNVYNNDIKYNIQQTTSFYKKHPNDNIQNQQKLSTLFLDIEVYTENNGFKDSDLEEAPYTIHLITLISSEYKKINTYLLLFENNYEKFGIKQNMTADEYSQFVSDTNKWLLEELRKGKYVGHDHIPDHFEIDLKIYYQDEKKMLIDCWNQIHEYDPDILTSWNGDNFDYPYIYYRLIKLFGKEAVPKILSKFGKVDLKNGRVQFFEYCVADMLYFYRPRDEGGLQYGKKRARYSLDHIAEVELGIKKISYKEENISLDEFFILDPRNTTLYNIVDVLLIYGLQHKLQFMELHNTIRRAMKTPLQNSIIGSSAFYECHIFSELTDQNKKVRYGLTTEGSISFSKEYLSRFGPIKSKQKLLQPRDISAREVASVTKKFPGAYVKQPYPEIINDGIVIDFDATSMYPSNIIQGNISFDCYMARIIPPQCHKTINLLKTYLGTGQYPQALISSIQYTVELYVDKNDINPKGEAIQLFTYTMLGLFQKLMDSGKTLDQLFHPTTTEESLLLKNILLPLLDTIYTTHKDSTVYNPFVYDWVYMEPLINDVNNIRALQQKYPEGVYLVTNPMDSNCEVNQISLPDLAIIIQNQWSLSFSGCMFMKHKDKLGLFLEMLMNFADLRKEHKDKRNLYKKGSSEYKFEDNNQNVFKRLMNTSYGLYGLANFRYSNHWLARTITNNSLHALKCSMYFIEQYMTNEFDHNSLI